MMKIFISQPINGVSDADILAKRNEIANLLKEQYGDIEIIDTSSKPHGTRGTGRLWYLLDADAAYFVEGWEQVKNCVFEHEACNLHDIKILKD